MKKKSIPPTPETDIHAKDAMVEINEALVLGSVRQHELTEAAEALNTRLELEITERKRAEGSLRISEIRYRRLFEAASDGLLLIDPLDGKITDANPSITRLSGYPQDQLVGRQLWEIGLFANQTANRRMFTKLKKKPEIHYGELPLEHRDGHRLTVEVVASLYRENGHTVIQCHIRDITERKSAEDTQRRIDVLSASNVKLKKEIVQRQAAEKSLQQSQQSQILLLEQAEQQEDLLRDMSHRILCSQEDERKRISRELHDIISQNLIGVNVSIAALSNGDPASFSDDFRQKITNTQQIVESTVDRLHLFARELRPAMLDDLGLIPALQALLERFMEETGIRSSLTVFAGIEESEGDVLTVLYRVAQEALSNVALHSNASRVAVSITTTEGCIQSSPNCWRKCFSKMNISTTDGCIQLEIKDDGKGFNETGKDIAAKKGRLGLLGMKERVEMVGGCFQIESLPGKGTTVRTVFSNRIP
jgi:PAS domain S-box-containing protein